MERIPALQTGSESDVLLGVLDFLRATVVTKLAGLTDEQAFGRSVPPSTLTPAGVVKHLTAVERWWFSIDFADDASMPPLWDEADPDGNFPIRPGDTVATIIGDYVAECDRSRRVARSAPMDDPARGPGMTFQLRYAMAHMIEETGRHCGHLDLLRERIDGATGE